MRDILQRQRHLATFVPRPHNGRDIRRTHETLSDGVDAVVEMIYAVDPTLCQGGIHRCRIDRNGVVIVIRPQI